MNAKPQKQPRTVQEALAMGYEYEWFDGDTCGSDFKDLERQTGKVMFVKKELRQQKAIIRGKLVTRESLEAVSEIAFPFVANWTFGKAGRAKAVKSKFDGVTLVVS